MSTDHPSLKKHKGVKSASLICSIKSSSPIVNEQSSANVTVQSIDETPSVQVQVSNKEDAVDLQSTDEASSSVEVSKEDIVGIDETPSVQVQVSNKEDAVDLQSTDEASSSCIQVSNKEDAVDLQSTDEASSSSASVMNPQERRIAFVRKLTKNK
jgi:hypothetical protein